MAKVVRKRKKSGLLKRIGKATILSAGLAGASVITPIAIDHFSHGAISRAIGKNIILGHSRTGQYWEGIKEHEEFKAKLEGREYDGRDLAERLGEEPSKYPNLEIIDKWSSTKDNEIVIYSGDEKSVQLLKKPARRIDTKCEEIPETVKKALVLREDQEYYEHGGINWRGKLRAVKQYVFSGRLIGGSGITEQVAKLIFAERGKALGKRDTSRSSLLQKLREELYAIQLDAKVGKDKVLCFYANNVYLGDGNYGFKAAAKDYFGKELNQLNFGEALFLAVLIQNPGRNPKNDNGQGFGFQIRRYNAFLDSLYENGKITESDYNKYKEPGSIKLVGKKKEQLSKRVFPSSLDALFAEFKDKLGVDLYTILSNDPDPAFGFKVYTTVRKTEVQRLQRSVDFGLNHRTAEFGGAVLDEEARILAVVGRKNNTEIGNYNFAVDPEVKKLPVASTIKALHYAMAINDEVISMEDTENDSTDGMKDAPKNWDDEYGGEMTLREALTSSNNIIAVKTFNKYVKTMGYKRFLEYLEKLGFDIAQYKDLKSDSSVALGSKGGVTTIGLAAAYLAFNDGHYIKPTIVDRIEISGKIYRPQREKVKVFKRATVEAIKESLRDAGKAFKSLPPNVEVKTGTSSEYTVARVAALQHKNGETRAVSMIVANEDGSSLGEGQYARVILNGPLTLGLQQAYLDRTLKNREEALAMLQPEEGLEGTIAEIIDNTTNRETRTTIAGCEYDLDTIKTILEEENADAIQLVRESLRSCRLEAEIGSENWSKYRLGEAMALERVYMIRAEERGSGMYSMQSLLKTAIVSYRDLIAESNSEDIIDIARERLDDLEEKLEE